MRTLKDMEQYLIELESMYMTRIETGMTPPDLKEKEYGMASMCTHLVKKIRKGVK